MTSIKELKAAAEAAAEAGEYASAASMYARALSLANGSKLKSMTTSIQVEIPDDCPPGEVIEVSEGMTLKLWFGEDLKDWTEDDNGGRSCADVYAVIHGTFDV